MLDLLEKPHRSADEEIPYCEKAKKASAQLLRRLREVHGCDEAFCAREPEPPRPEPTVVLEPTPVKEPWFSPLRDDGSDRILIADIAKACARRFGIPLHELRSHRRVRNLVRARFIIYFLACTLTGRSSVYVGRRLMRDHATILNGIRKIERLRQTDTCLEMDLRTIAATVGGSLDN